MYIYIYIYDIIINIIIVIIIITKKDRPSPVCDARWRTPTRRCTDGIGTPDPNPRN